MRSFVKHAFAATVLVGAGLVAASAQAEGDKIGETQTCVPLQYISETRVIDDQTILIELHGKKYKRMDMVAPCGGLAMGYGYIHHTHTNDLCTTDVLKVNQPVGATCMIKQIVTIGADEAKQLKKRAH